MQRIPDNQQLEVDGRGIHLAAALGQVGEATQSGRTGLPQTLVVGVAAATIRYHSRSRNPPDCHASIPPSGTYKNSFVSK